MSKNDGEFDEFTFEELPSEWINREDAECNKSVPIQGVMDPKIQKQLEKTLELRLEIPATGQVFGQKFYKFSNIFMTKNCHIGKIASLLFKGVPSIFKSVKLMEDVNFRRI